MTFSRWKDKALWITLINSLTINERHLGHIAHTGNMCPKTIPVWSKKWDKKEKIMPLNKRMILRKKKLNPSNPKMACAKRGWNIGLLVLEKKFAWNWPMVSGEENEIVYRKTDDRWYESWRNFFNSSLILQCTCLVLFLVEIDSEKF